MLGIAKAETQVGLSASTCRVYRLLFMYIVSSSLKYSESIKGLFTYFIRVRLFFRLVCQSWFRIHEDWNLVYEAVGRPLILEMKLVVARSLYSGVKLARVANC